MLFSLLLSSLAFAGLQAGDPHPHHVAELIVTERFTLLDGRPFGDAGAFERIDARVVFHFDPEDPWMQRVVDFDLAPRVEDGHVEAVADLMIIRPLERPEHGGTALMEVSNRGGKASLRYFCGGRGGSDPRSAGDFGDGLLLERGCTLVWLGWQADVPGREDLLGFRAPRAVFGDEGVRGPVRADWRVDQEQGRLSLGHRGHQPYLPIDSLAKQATLTRRPSRLGQREVVPRDEWTFDGGDIVGSFSKGFIYELVYESRDPWVLGLGPAALAHFSAWLKDEQACPFPVEQTVAVGISQTGRFLRHFLFQGFQDLGEGQPAFDGVLVLTAGAGRGSFNHRFGQPSRDAHQNSAFFYPTDLFPFSTQLQRDPRTGSRASLLDGLEHRGVMPKLFQINTGYEYWGRAAALTHTSVEGAVDVAPHDKERLYHIRGAQHFPVPWPRGLTNSMLQEAKDAPVFQGSPVNNLTVYRALLVRMLDWVEFDEQPPESRIPSITQETLIGLEGYRLPTVRGVASPPVAEEAYPVDYGPRWQEGIVDREPPLLGTAYPVLVPRVNQSGNEVSGVPTLELLVPLGSFLPYHLDATRSDGQPALTDFFGSFIPFAPSSTVAESWGDSRPALDELYPDVEAFETRVEKAVDELISDGWLLSRDAEAMISEARRRWSSLSPASGR